MKQSSIKWLVTELNQMIDYIPTNKWDAIADIVQQAKQMHKEEIIKILNKREDYLGTQPSVFDYLTNEEWFEQYYQETYGGDTK